MNILDRFRLDGQVALVTGAGRGIGAACAIAFAQAGAKLVIGARSVEQLQETADQIKTAGSEALVVALDVRDEQQRQQFVENAMAKYGRIDCLVNNAGGGIGPRPLMKTRVKDFESDFNFNTTSAFALTQLVAPHMHANGKGSIVNISSVAGLRPHSCFSAYGTAKAAMSYLSQQLAQELAPSIRVNAIAVGSTKTQALNSVLTEEIEQKMVELTPLQRLGEVEDIAAAALYLASPAASYVTGDILLVNGGLQTLNMEMPKAFQ